MGLTHEGFKRQDIVFNGKNVQMIQNTETAVNKREITFTKKGGKKIRGRIYLPENRDRKLPIVIFCHGFGSNFRELMHHGDGFAEAGICCLFFDFCGGGPESVSDGSMEEMTVTRSAKICGQSSPV